MVGCGGRPPVSTDAGRATAHSLNAIAELYGSYLQLHRGRPPTDEAVFREFVEENAETLQLYDIDSVDQLLTSARDGQPFEIVYGKRIPVNDSPGAMWVAFEQRGIDGGRMAARSYGGVDLLTEAELQQELTP